MKTYAPENYTRFVCAAGACRHTCCMGWEIDIDDASLARYRRMSGALGDKLRRCIQVEDGQAHFRLDAEERCPFLTTGGLCELILSEGADSLCQVCADHPRFRSFFHGRTEVGLGLCCEAAARLVLLDPEPMRLTLLSDDGLAEDPLPEEAALLTLRARLIALMQQRERPISARLSTLCAAVGASPAQRSLAAWARFLLELEVLDPAWRGRLEALITADEPSPDAMDALSLPMEQLAVYLLYRHLPESDTAGGVRALVCFIVLALRLVAALAGTSPDGVIDAARMFSAEIEYSEENMEAVLGTGQEGLCPS